MLPNIFKLKNFIPNECYKTIFDIDYNKLYEEGKRILLIDLDNTLISYSQNVLTKEVHELFKKLDEMGFKIVLISNNTQKRLITSIEDNDIMYVYSARKPLKKGFKKALKNFSSYHKNNIILIGDQLMTDVLGAKNFGIDVILVKSIERKTEKWYTRFNRRLERRVLKKMSKKYPKVYEKIMFINGEK